MEKISLEHCHDLFYYPTPTSLAALFRFVIDLIYNCVGCFRLHCRHPLPTHWTLHLYMCLHIWDIRLIYENFGEIVRIRN